MNFTVSYELFRGDVSTVASGEASESVVLIKSSNFYDISGTKKEQSITFKIPCPNDDFASTVALFIKNRFDSGDSIVFSGTFPHDNLVIVSVPLFFFRLFFSS